MIIVVWVLAGSWIKLSSKILPPTKSKPLLFIYFQLISQFIDCRTFFLAGRWLADDEDDKQTFAEIAAQNEDGVAVAPLVNYQVKVWTGDRRGAGKQALV